MERKTLSTDLSGRSTPVRTVKGRQFRRRFSWAKALFKAVGVTLLVLMLVEIGCYLVAKNPSLVPSGPLLYVLRATFFNNRDLVQYSRECAQYDNELTYTLKPGECKFKGLEFNTTFKINRLGLRDDGISLESPEIVVLGDSHAMGWGVDQEQTFAQRIERISRKRVLNAAISSYATAREMAMLRRIDRSKLKLLIVQYCSNDFAENRHFQKQGNKLIPMPRETYESILRDFEGSRRYYPGKFVVRTLEVQVARRIRRLLGDSAVPDTKGPAPRANSPDYEAELFLNALFHQSMDFRGIPIIVISIDSYGPYDPKFLTAVQRISKTMNGLEIHTLDLRHKLGTEDFFRVDDHLNSAGHKRIADEILTVMQTISNSRDYRHLRPYTNPKALN